MSMPHRTRLVNPWLGTYFGIFASTFVALVLVLLMLELLGAPKEPLSLLMLAAPLALYAVIGLAARTEEPAEFFAGGRRVPALITGLGIAMTTLGATLIVGGAGLFFVNGFDAWCVMLGAIAGFVVMAILIAPYLRKVGAYTVPGYLGRRFESRIVRLTAAALLAVPMLLVIAAELRMGAMCASLLTGASPRAAATLLLVVIVTTVALGGMRSINWSGTAQAIVAILALLVPATIVAVTLTNLPLPQLSYGSVIKSLARIEWSNAVPRPILSPLAFDLAGQGFETVRRQFPVPYGSVGPMSFVLMTLTVMAGVASAPWLLMRTVMTPGVYEARKSLGWAAVVAGLVMLTLAGIAVFMRHAMLSELIGRDPVSPPDWLQALRQLGIASLDGRTGRITFAAFAVKRDGVLFALPVTAGLPRIGLDLALAGGLAAALAAAGATVVALGTLVAEDAFAGLARGPVSDGIRLALGRAAIAGVALAGGLIAAALPFDPLRLVLWALAISGSTVFTVLVLSVLWKRLTLLGAMAGMVAGFTVAILAVLAGEAAWFGVPSVLAGAFGIPASLAAAAVVSQITPAPGRQLREFVREMRVPGGETIHDRETRLQRLKQRQRS